MKYKYLLEVQHFHEKSPEVLLLKFFPNNMVLMESIVREVSQAVPHERNYHHQNGTTI